MKAKRLVQSIALVILVMTPSLDVESFHDPENTRVFPQLVVGQVGSLSYFPVLRACSPGPFQDQVAIFQTDRSTPTNLLINGQPYQGPVPFDLGAQECVTYEMTVGDQLAILRTRNDSQTLIGLLIIETLVSPVFRVKSPVPTGVTTASSSLSRLALRRIYRTFPSRFSTTFGITTAHWWIASLYLLPVPEAASDSSPLGAAGLMWV